MAIGSTIVASILVGGAIGMALDHWLATDPWCTVGGLLAFMLAGLYHAVKEAQR